MSKKKSVIPSLFTMGNMVMGFVSILFAAKYDASAGNISCLAVAGILIFVASIFDLLDGAVARALDVESEIGMQLDSLADAVAYGIAPGVLAYQAYFYQFPDVLGLFSSGILISIIFPVCAIFRLARFNCEEGGSGFTGLPSPAAGIAVSIIPALFYPVKLAFVGEVSTVFPLWAYVAVYVIAAFLMVSEIDYSKLFSDIWKKGMTVRLITAVIVIILLILFKTWAIFTVTFLYIIWGLIKYILPDNK